MRRLANGLPEIGSLSGKSRLLSTFQSSWVISRKELEVAKLCGEMMFVALKAMHHLKCDVYMWIDSQIVLVDYQLDKLIASFYNLYLLEKHFAHLCTFVAFVIAKAKKVKFVSPVWNANYLNQAFRKTIKYVQSHCFGPAMTFLNQGTPDDFEAIVIK